MLQVVGVMRAQPGKLADTLIRHHRSLDDALEDVKGLATRRRFSEARTRLARFIDEWERQVRVEEDLLYPLFELRVGMVGGGTSMMREEHRTMRRNLERIMKALGQRRSEAAEEAGDELRSLLGSHFSREERVLFPALDALLTDWERGRLLERLEGGARAAS